jgi:predicted adenine nucleotide alpha hydrolase (AANH) superfamily ATPase
VEEMERLIGEMPFKHKVKFIEGEYKPKDFYDMARGMEHEPEGGIRCMACYRMRLEHAAAIAKEGGYDYFTTTLTISPLKRSDKINEIGNEVAEQYGVTFLPSDFKKRGGYLRSIELSRQYNLYRQNFCGCVFSKREETSADE